MSETSSSVGAWNLEGLPAAGPSVEHRQKLMLFGQFVGDWEIVECRSLQRTGRWDVSRGEVHWRWVLDGSAVQDVWMTYDEEGHRMVPDGTTVRFYDPTIDAWHSVWLAPPQHAVRVFIGRPVGKEIVLEGEADCTPPIRWIFSEIAHESFRWRGEQRETPDAHWTPYEEMRIRRVRPPSADPRSRAVPVA